MINTINYFRTILFLLASLCIIDVKAISSSHTENRDSIGANLAVLDFTQLYSIDSDSLVVSHNLKSFVSEIDSLMRVDTITHVDVTGIASIDGPVVLNNRLAMNRSKTMSRWLIDNTLLPASLITTAARGEDWNLFRKLVVSDTAIPARNQLLDIIDSDLNLNAKEARIRPLAGGRTWRYLATNIFPQMRCAEVTVDYKRRYLVRIPEDMTNQSDTVDYPMIEEIYEAEAPVQEVLLSEDAEQWRRRFYIKTDLPYWLMTWSNLAFEVDLGSHWSFNLPVYFSAVNYFKRTIKFRVAAFQPGFRYWIRPNNTGVYFEAHYGMGWWNFAFNGKYRYQDHFRKTPTMGGGIGAGYRLPISSNGRWAMEFGAGAGVYRLHYDRFQNRANGKLIDSHSKTVFFLDNLNVSISYSFPIEKRKGGEK